MSLDWLTTINFSQEVMFRIGLALILGSLIGLEREWSGHEAGLRTNILIAVSAALFTFVGIESFPLVGNARDSARVAAQIVSGVGFLGAGALIQTQDKIKGLTTAATIWLVAAVGMAAGAGAYFSAVFSTLLALVVLRLLAPISKGLEARVERQKEKEEAVEEIKKLSKPETPLERQKHEDEQRF
jgi:putative Mg2+ transporter-C (MgtC) family protein